MGVQRWRLTVPLAMLLAATALAACGSDDFKNEPRPPAPIELSARISTDTVVVSPRDVGAGLATINISNQSADPSRLVLQGPTDAESEEIVAGGVGSLRLPLEEGDYTVSNGAAGSARDTRLTVGPERPSSQNDLLLP